MRKLKKLITGRAVPTALALLVQLVLAFFIILRVSYLFVYYLIISYAVAVVLGLRIINKRTNMGYKIGWLLLLLVVPLFGAFLYVTINGEGLHSVKIRKLAKIHNSGTDMPDCETVAELDCDSARLQSEYIRKYTLSAPVRNTKSLYFSSGEEFFDSLLKDLRTAEHHIYMEYFILKAGYMWNEIKNVLVEKSRQGVDVRIIVDDFGGIDKIGRRERKELKENGIRLKFFNPFVPVISGLLNNRDHRKICVIDTKTAYCGGVNIGDEYINLDEKFGYFKDSGIAMYGEAAYTFEVFFLTLWEYITGEKFKLEKPQFQELDYGVFHPYTDSPVDREYVSKNIYMNMINRAEKYVYISTPYFVVDDEMLTSILNSAKSGVDVRIIVPHIPDKVIVNQVTKSFYERLLEAGVKVYEYKKGFNHSKLVIADDLFATVGSVNFDYRSFYLSFECGVWMYKTDAIPFIKGDFLTMLKESIEITKEQARANIFLRLFRGVLSAFAPML
ncbi:MAG: cardiolipin synthase [Clostridia bacterium]|nr:cardiolipin synthase [Clostridia bacterium]